MDAHRYAQTLKMFARKARRGDPETREMVAPALEAEADQLAEHGGELTANQRVRLDALIGSLGVLLCQAPAVPAARKVA